MNGLSRAEEAYLENHKLKEKIARLEKDAARWEMTFRFLSIGTTPQGFFYVNIEVPYLFREYTESRDVKDWQNCFVHEIDTLIAGETIFKGL